MCEKITIFNAKRTSSKIPLSFYDDNTFIFETHNTVTNLEMFSTMATHFILNIPLINLKKGVRTFRRKANLDQYYGNKITYIILDIDKISSEFNQQKVLEYFKDYKVILGESKSYNGINNFNMKGIIFTEDIDFDDIKLALSSIHHDLAEYCEIDEAAIRKASLNAPILKNNVFLNNEDGIRFKFVKKATIEHINDIKSQYIKTSTDFNIDIKELQSVEADSMEKLCLTVFQTMGFTATKNNPNDSISFKHPSEKKSPGGYFWFSSSPYTMHHGNSTRSINIFDNVRKLPLAKALMKKEIDYNTEFLQFNTDTDVVQVNEKYLNVTPVISNKIQEFLGNSNGLLSIRSPMGTGKSTIINHIIEECHEQDMRVLVVTNRISVAHDFGKKYGIKVYNLDKYNIGDSLICQFDSLWKYNMKFFDVVVMDEFISIMTHARSDLNNNSLNIAKLFGAFNKKLVIADAFLTGYENFLLSHKKNNIHLIDNTYRDPTTLYSYEDQNYFVNSLVLHAEKSRVTVSATSLQFIHSLQLLLQNRGLKVVTLTAETPTSTKKLVYELFEEEEHDKWDVLIYSPTLTVGVSNLNDVPYHFHYDSSMSTDVISSIQMIKRTRKSKEIHMFIKERINYLKTSYNELRDEYMGNIGKNINYNYLFDIDNYGEAKLSEIGKKALKIDTFKNILEFNHKEAMMWLLQYHFLHEARIIKDKFEGNILLRYSNRLKTDKKELLLSNVDQFLNLNNIEKSSLLQDADADKTMRVLAVINDDILDCDVEIKTKILEIVLKDMQFIKKAKYYSIVKDYTHNVMDDTDIKSLVSKSVIAGDNDDLHFFNTLLAYGQIPIGNEYLPKTINANKHLKYILNKCGYKVAKTEESYGFRHFVVDANVKKYHTFIK